MIIDKLESIWTAEEQETLAGFEQEQKRILQNGGNPVERFCDIENTYIEIENSVRERYIDSFSDNPDSIFQDIHEIVDATEKQEFLEECQKWLETLDDIKEFDSDSPKFETLLLQAKQSAAETYENCCNFILNRVLIQFDVIHHYQLDDKKMYEIIRKKVSEWYEPPEQKKDSSKTSVIQKIPQLKSKLPNYHISPINRLANELQHNIINNGEMNITVAGKGTDSPTTTYILATYQETDSIKMSGKPYTEYDRQVHDAVCSLWEYGHKEHIMTSEMIFRAMTHDTKTKCPSPQQIGAVTKSIEKMRHIHVEVDATEEMKIRKVTLNGEPVKSCTFNDNLLSCREIEVRAGGKTVKAYQMGLEPLLLTYARMTNQLATVSGELLAIREVVKDESTGKIKKITDSVVANSEIRIAVKGYLLRRIKVIENDKKKKKKDETKKQSNIILFDSLFKETGIQKNSKTARNIKEYCYQVFDYWKGMRFIKDYEKRESKGKGRKSIDAVIIKI